jgi:glycosyltransferase involved in cell wall biosynthesis
MLFGRIPPSKGISYFLSSLEKLVAKGINLNTVIAGKGKICFDINKCKKLDITIIYRYITNEELARLILGIKIVMCPYTDSTKRGEVMTAYTFDCIKCGGVKMLLEIGIMEY